MTAGIITPVSHQCTDTHPNWTPAFTCLTYLHELGVGDAVLRLSWGVGDGAELEGLLGGKEAEGAMETGGVARDDDTGLAREPLGATINQGYQGPAQAAHTHNRPGSHALTGCPQ